MAHPFASVPLGFSVMGRRRCGGAAAPGTRSPSRTCCPTSRRCWSRPAAPAAVVRCPGWSDATRRPWATRSPTSWCRPHASGTTSCAPAGTSGCSAASPAWTSGSTREGESRATSWTWPRCGGWPATGTTAASTPGYTRRDPATAAAYFRSVGLRGPFWGLGRGAGRLTREDGPMSTTGVRPDVEVSETVDAPPRAVYDLVSDVPRMGEWSPETASCRWLDGRDRPRGRRPVPGEQPPRPAGLGDHLHRHRRRAGQAVCLRRRVGRRGDLGLGLRTSRRPGRAARSSSRGATAGRRHAAGLDARNGRRGPAPSTTGGAWS